MLGPDGDKQIAAVDAIPLVILEGPLRPTEPASRASRPAAEQHVVTDPVRAADSTRHIAYGQIEIVGTLQAGHIVVAAADHVGRPR